MALNIDDLKVLGPDVSVKEHMENIINTKEDDESFYVLDIGVLVQQFRLWKERLPMVQPYYAVKCNDSKIVLETLSRLGTCFDCASKEEIRRALDAGAKNNEIIYANPCKPISHLKYAAAHGVSLMTFDSVCELQKVKMYFPNAKLVLRIQVDAPEGSCLIAFGGKFGCDPSKALDLIKKAAELGLQVRGISFHVGTGCMEPETYAKGIHIAARIIQEANRMGMKMEVLDIGGGFPGDSIQMFNEISKHVTKALKEEEVLEGVKIIAEPGRYFGCKAFTLAASVIALKETDTHNVYFINNGVYTSFNCVPTEKTKIQPHPFQQKYGQLKKSIIWGQTMEEWDKVVEECWLPELKVGDWLYFINMGAYSTCLSVQYHGFAIPKIYPVIHQDDWNILESSRKSSVQIDSNNSLIHQRIQIKQDA